MSESTGFLSAAELQSVQCLDRDAPYVLTCISSGQFSVARHYGGMKYLGRDYIYLAAHDECVRDDVYREVILARKAAERDARRAQAQAQSTRQGVLL